MKLRQLNRALHRDLGYFFFGVTLIYALSGIALNHRDEWNSNFIITNQQFVLKNPIDTKALSKEAVLSILDEIDVDAPYKTHVLSGTALKIFVGDGSVTVDLSSGRGSTELIRKRPLFNQLNFLHYNKPQKLWTWFADIYALALILLALTGLFIIKGKKGITGRGAWLTILGLLVPLLFLYLYL